MHMPLADMYLLQRSEAYLWEYQASVNESLKRENSSIDLEYFRSHALRRILPTATTIDLPLLPPSKS
ncbi:hypothetical protein F2Q69_00041742 [Brassica cretica]|uniref:Uncharacterized protein n=1 Tax=Brassica cretica TaxID=69181 RepID=A0A8S9NN75_BRACR|nr:hypothetical protein F2Q69_00041742 [Brassica cretica]